MVGDAAAGDPAADDHDPRLIDAHDRHTVRAAAGVDACGRRARPTVCSDYDRERDRPAATRRRSSSTGRPSRRGRAASSTRPSSAGSDSACWARSGWRSTATTRRRSCRASSGPTPTSTSPPTGATPTSIASLLTALGYVDDREVYVASEGRRSIFDDPARRIHLDVFYDRLEFCHVIPLAGRLEVGSADDPAGRAAALEAPDRQDQREGRRRHRRSCSSTTRWVAVTPTRSTSTGSRGSARTIGVCGGRSTQNLSQGRARSPRPTPSSTTTSASGSWRRRGAQGAHRRGTQVAGLADARPGRRPAPVVDRRRRGRLRSPRYVLDIPFYVWDLADPVHATTSSSDFVVRVRRRGHAEPLPAVQREDQVRGAAGSRRSRSGSTRSAPGTMPGWSTGALRRGLDPDKDQSYVLAGSPPRAGARMFPIGDSPRRRCAPGRARGLAVADKPDSDDICFIPAATHGYLGASRGRGRRRRSGPAR